MKEIHAYQGNDGTYYVEIIGETTYQTKDINGYLFDETVQTKTVIPRAQVHIDALAWSDDNEVLTTLTLGGDSDELS
jgi:hypothetical protein